MPLNGGCLCGKVRYTITADPVFVGICHCTNCQKQSGAAFSVNVGVRAESLDLTGTLQTYVDHGDSGREVLRRFCPNCGSPVITDAAAYPGIHIVKAGTLDDPGQVRPGRQIFCASKHPWMPILDGIAAFDKAPPPAR
ncbi:MAG: GFA family protein [Acetobacteraceae bacterium]